MEQTTLGGGCFWCIEAVYQEVAGVTSAISGYAGGHVVDPTYQEVCTERTGHAEVVRVTFDPAKISYREVLEIFFTVHDPSTLNRQGADVGSQYRSVIYTHSAEQETAARAIIAEIDASGAYRGKVVTEVAPLPTFYIAEEYHQEYFIKNPLQGYCQAVVAPKVLKFRKTFSEKRKQAA